jgi:hypothetical protein
MKKGKRDEGQKQVSKRFKCIWKHEFSSELKHPVKNKKFVTVTE